MLSRALLIARALLHMQVGTSAFRDLDAALCDRQGGAVPPGRGRFCPREHPPRARPWRRGSPDPIPNSEVKPAIAESTAESVRGRIGRRARGGCFLSAGPRTDTARGPARVWGVLWFCQVAARKFSTMERSVSGMTKRRLGPQGARVLRTAYAEYGVPSRMTAYITFILFRAVALSAHLRFMPLPRHLLKYSP